MTSDEAIGKSVREFKEKNERVAVIKSELRRIGDELVKFGTALQKKPALIQLGRGGFEHSQLPHVVNPPQAQNLDLQRLGELIGELRQLEDSLETLRREMAAFGIKPE